MYRRDDTESICIYDRTGGFFQTITKQGEIIKRPCRSIKCPRHTWHKRFQYARLLTPILKRAKRSYFATFPIGPIIEQAEFSTLWESFTNSMRYSEIRADYLVIKEVQRNKFHLHGVYLSEEDLPTLDIRRKWLKFLGKHVTTRKRLEHCYLEPIVNPQGAANYLFKNTRNDYGITVMPRAWHRNIVLASTGMREAIRGERERHRARIAGLEFPQ